MKINNSARYKLHSNTFNAAQKCHLWYVGTTT